MRKTLRVLRLWDDYQEAIERENSMLVETG